MEPNPELGIMQSVFSPASRREALGEHSEGGRRDGGLKMDRTKPLGRDLAMGVDCRLYVDRGSERAKDSHGCGIQGMNRSSYRRLLVYRWTTCVPRASSK
jgi:hypothetical protein